MDINEADKVIHPVETQWHYEIMTKHRFIPLDKTDVGLVRSYRYKHPNTDHYITVSTGYHSDHWKDETTGDGGYHGTLEAHLERLSKKWERTVDLHNQIGELQ